MFEELVCPNCHNPFSLKSNYLVCNKCKKTYPIRENIVDLWKIEDEKKNVGKEKIDLEISTTNHIDELLKEKSLINRGMDEFIQRTKGTSNAARLMDQKIIDDLLQLLPKSLKNKKVLIIGCGTGKDVHYFYERGARDMVLTDIQKSFFPMAKKNKGVKYLFSANAENLPLKNNSFDIAIFGATLHHIPNPYKAVEKAGRVAKVVTCYSEPSDMRELYPFIKKIGWEKDYGEVKMVRINPEEAKNILEKNNFQVIIKTDYCWFPLKLFKNYVNSPAFLKMYFLCLKIADIFVGRWGHNLTFYAHRSS